MFDRRRIRTATNLLLLLLPITARFIFALSLLIRFVLIFLLEVVKENSKIFSGISDPILAGIAIIAEKAWKRIWSKTVEIKFQAGIKNQSSVRKAGIEIPEQGVRPNSSEKFLCSAKLRWKTISAGKGRFQRKTGRTEQALIQMILRANEKVGLLIIHKFLNIVHRIV